MTLEAIGNRTGTMKSLLETIERVLHEGGEWCTLEKATTLASMIVALRPRRVVEIGVWMGGSAIPMALALQHVNDPDSGMIAIDPWSPTASASGETEKNAAWWRSVDHEKAYQTFVSRLEKHALRSIVAIERAASDNVIPPAPIDLLHIDGNHREQARRDVERFACNVRIGGIAILDDLGWDGGYVDQGVELARTMGFVDLYRLDKGLVMQRVHDPNWGLR